MPNGGATAGIIPPLKSGSGLLDQSFCRLIEMNGIPPVAQVGVDPMTILAPLQPYSPNIRSSPIAKIPMSSFSTFRESRIELFNSLLSRSLIRSRRVLAV